MERREEEILKTLSKIKKIYAKKQKKLEKHIRASKVKAHVKQKLKEQSDLEEKQQQKQHVIDNDKIIKKSVCEISQVSGLIRVSGCKGENDVNKSELTILNGEDLKRKNKRTKQYRTGRNKKITGQVTHTKGDNSGTCFPEWFYEPVTEISKSNKCGDTLNNVKLLDNRCEENVKAEGDNCNSNVLDQCDNGCHGYSVSSDSEDFRVLRKSNTDSQLSHHLVTKNKLSLKKNKGKDEVKRENIVSDSVESACLSFKSKNLPESENNNDLSSNCSDSLFSQDIFQEASVSGSCYTESKDELNTCIRNIDINNDSVGCENCIITKNEDAIGCKNHKTREKKNSVGCENPAISIQNIQKKSVKERRKSCPEMVNFFLKDDQDFENKNVVNVRRRKRRSRLSMPRQNSPQLCSSQSDCILVTSESSEEYQTLKLIQENYCVGLDRTTRKRNLTNSPLLISSIFQYFIDEGLRQKETEDFTLPIISYGILIQNKVDLSHETLAEVGVESSTNDSPHENQNPAYLKSCEKGREISRKSENEENVENQLQYNHQLSFKPPDFDNLVLVDVCSIEHNQKKINVVICLYKQYISLWKHENNGFISFKRLQLPQGHTILRSYRLFRSDEILSFVIKVVTNQGHPSFMAAMFEMSNNSDSCILPVVSFKSQRACVCCLKDKNFVVSGDSVVVKYTFDTELHMVSSVLSLDKASGELTSLQRVDGIDSALLGITETNELHIWNHESGSLLRILDITSAWSCLSMLTDGFWDEGYFFVSMLTSDKSDSAGCLMMINPQTEQHKVLHQYQTSHWNGLKHTFQLQDSCYLGAIDKQHTLHIWDTLSGTEILTQTMTINICQFKDIIVIQRSNCIHVFKLS